jgi:hypothetical protein
MGLNSAFGAVRHKYQVFSARLNCLFNRILNERFIDHGQHLFGHGFGRWQEPRAPPRYRKNCCTNWFHDELEFTWSKPAFYLKPLWQIVAPLRSLPGSRRCGDRNPTCFPIM